jgi:hypothetical protein
MSRACSTNGAQRNVYRIFVGKSEGKRPLGRPRCSWVDNIKMDLREIGCRIYWIVLAHDRDQWGSCEQSDEPSGSVKCWEILK